MDKLSKQKIPFTPEETELILGQTASVLNKLNEKKLELNKEDLQVPEDKLKDIYIKFDLGKLQQPSSDFPKITCGNFEKNHKFNKFSVLDSGSSLKTGLEESIQRQKSFEDKEVTFL